MNIENLAGKWPNVAINPATGKTYEAEHMDNGVSVQMCLNDTREQLEADVYGGWLDDFSRGKVLELLDRQAAITEYELNKERVALIEEINRLRKVCRTQADSFAAIENENAALRSKLNRIRELAERLQNA